MKTQAIIITVIMAVALHLSGCSSRDNCDALALTGQDPATTAASQRMNKRMLGMPNPAAVYCGALGYEYEIVTNEKGNQSGICVFPDGSACQDRDWYRGNCGQEWSYCKRCGYELKDLAPRESLLGGAICIDGSTNEQIGTVFDLVVDRFLRGESLPELRR